MKCTISQVGHLTCLRPNLFNMRVFSSYNSEKISGKQVEDNDPDMCSTSDFNNTEIVPGEQAEKLVNEDKTDGNP